MKSSEFTGCQDHACLIQKPKQGTCGGRCRCSHAKIEAYIDALKDERAIAEKKLELATAGLGMIRELDRIGNGVTPEEVSDYEQGMISGFEIAAEVAAETAMKISGVR